jgi:hypothetical protein
LHQLQLYMHNRRIDIMFLSETLLASDAQTAAIHAPAAGLRWLGCHRPAAHATGQEPDNTERNDGRRGGGIGFLVGHRVQARVLAKMPAGAMSIEVTRPRHEALAIIGAYVPPASSRYEHLGPRILDFVRQEYHRLSGTYRVVLILGDFNARIGNMLGRSCACPPQPRPGTRDRELATLFRELGVSPLHGRAGTPPAAATSRSPNPAAGGRAEVDYIAARCDLPTQEYSPMRTPQHGHQGLFDFGSTHVPIGARLSLRQRREMARRNERAATGRNAHGTGRAARLTVPYYNDRTAWHAASVVLQDGLHLVLSLPDDPTALDEAMSSLLQQVAKRAHDHVTMGDGASAIGAALLHTRGSRRRRTRKHARWGGGLPATVTAALRARDALLHKHRRTGAQEAELKALNKAARAAVRRCARIVNVAFATQAELVRQRSKRDFTKVVKRDTPDEPPEDGDNGMNATVALQPGQETELLPALLASNTALYRESRDSVPGLTDAAKRQKYLHSLPRAPCPALAASIAPEEVWRVLLPPHEDVTQLPCTARCSAAGCEHATGLRGAAGPDDSGCVLCRHQRDHHARYFAAREPAAGGAPPLPVPDYPPRVHTAKAADALGITVEHLRFPRGAEPAEWVNERRRTCAALTRLFNSVLNTGVVPDAWKHSVAVPLYKGRKAGPPASPDAYRTIAIGSCIAKVFCLVILARLQHWAERNGILSPQQVGFRPGRSAEAHVWTVRETVKHLIRTGHQQVTALFIDFRKAYDNVHQGALWEVLSWMGVPPKLLTVLINMNTGRTLRLRMGGSFSDPVSVTKGVPQGDALSPLLFNFFIETLHRMLAARLDLGVTVATAAGSLHLSHLAYADDMVLLGTGRACTAQQLAAVQDWCADWGLELAAGPSKTAAIQFNATTVTAGGTGVATASATVAHAAPHADTATPLTVGQLTVPWVSEYKYLGHGLRNDLDMSSVPAKILKTMRWLFFRYFLATDMTRLLPVAAQLEVFKTFVQGPVMYLACIAPTTRTLYDKVDTVIKRAARLILHLPATAPQLLPLADARLLPTAAVLVRARTRFLLYLEDEHGMLHGDIAPALHRLLRHATAPRAAAGQFPVAILRPWAQETSAFLQRELAPTPITAVPRPRGAWDAPRVAAVAARWSALGNHYLTAASRSNLTPAALMRPTGRQAQARTALRGWQRPPAAPPSAHVAAAHWGYIHPRPMETGDHGASTPWSARGPGCSGSPLAMTRVPATETAYMARLHMGRVALGRPPFTRGGRVLVEAADAPTGYSDTDGSSDGESTAGGNPEAPAAASRSTGGEPAPSAIQRTQPNRTRRGNLAVRAEHACLLCGQPDEDPLHLAVYCTHDAMRRHQRLQAASAQRFLERLLGAHLKAVAEGGWQGTIPNAELQGRIITARKAAAAVKWASADGQFVLYRLLHVLPWPARVIDAGWPLARALGDVFDHINTVPRTLRRPVDEWVRWAVQQRRHVASAWAAAIAAKRASIRADAIVDGRDGIAAARALFPRGALIHIGLPLLLPPWDAFINGVCDGCNRPCGEWAEADVQAAACVTCNAVRCGPCVGVTSKVTSWLDDSSSAWEWLCPQCTLGWWCEAALGPPPARAAVAGGDVLARAAAHFERSLASPQPVVGHAEQVVCFVLADKHTTHQARTAATPTRAVLMCDAASTPPTATGEAAPAGTPHVRLPWAPPPAVPTNDAPAAAGIREAHSPGPPH